MADETQKAEEIIGANYITQKLEALYPDGKGLFYHAQLPFLLGGKDPLDCIAVYESNKGIPHWHYVTFGFSEQYRNDSDDGENSSESPAPGGVAEDTDDEEEIKLSKYGFELTFRLKKEGEEPPVWPVNLLQNLARYVFSTGNCFDEGHHLNCNGPVMLECDTKLRALGFCRDPELQSMDTCNGYVKFLQAVAVTLDEMQSMMYWDGEKFLAELFRHIPYGVTDLGRDTLLCNPKFKAAVDKGIEMDGSSTGYLYMVNGFHCNMDNESGRFELALGAMTVPEFQTMLRARLRKRRSLLLDNSDGEALLLDSKEQYSFHTDKEGLRILCLPDRTLQEIAALVQPHVGTYHCTTAPFTISVFRSEIKDSNGNVTEIVE